MVLARARSRLACCTREGFFATPMEIWNRKLNSSSVSSLTFCSRSSPLISRQLSAFIMFWGGATAAPPPDPPNEFPLSCAAPHLSPFWGGATAAPPPDPPNEFPLSCAAPHLSPFWGGATAAPPPDPPNEFPLSCAAPHLSPFWGGATAAPPPDPPNEFPLSCAAPHLSPFWGGATAAPIEGWLGSPSAAPHTASPDPPTGPLPASIAWQPFPSLWLLVT